MKKWKILYDVMLVVFTAFVLLKTFVISDVKTAQAESTGIYTETSADTSSSGSSGTAASDTSSSGSDSTAVITENSYQDDNISITVTEERIDGTTVYIADITVSSVEYLKSAFADNAYGRNIKETTSQMAEENSAILAINGDYYGFRDYGYVLRNGTLYRSNYSSKNDEAFVIYEDGSCETVKEGSASASSLQENGAVQVYSFGPGLVENGTISVSQNEEVSQSKSSNPRTAIGMISPLHYVFVVSDGRTSESTGLSLYQLASCMQDLGCTEAYNLDGGGSSTIYFNGQVINNPTDGNKSGEREVSDIVYIGY